MTDKPTPEDLLPLPAPVFRMLISPAESERHGYALKRDIARSTNGKVNLAAGVLKARVARAAVERQRLEPTRSDVCGGR